MNKLMICAIHDTKAEAYMNPFTMRSEGEAIRAFGDAIAKGGTPLADHPEDFVLVQLGWFSQDSGAIEVQFKSLVNGIDFKKGV